MYVLGCEPATKVGLSLGSWVQPEQNQAAAISYRLARMGDHGDAGTEIGPRARDYFLERKLPMSLCPYVLGVDPAKRKFTACLLDPDGAQVVAGDFDCTRSGFEALGAVLANALGSREALLFVGVEGSAAYDDNLLAFFEGLPHTVVLRLDPAQVRAFSGARPIRGKTDRADARRIATFARTYARELHRFESDPAALAMRRLIDERLTLATDLTVLKNRLRDRLITAFPEFELVFPNPAEALALHVLEAGPTAAHLARKRPSSLARMQAPQGGGHLGPERAERLHGLARTSIASATDEGEAAAVRRLIVRLRQLLEHVRQIEENLRAYVKTAAPLPPPCENTPLTIPQQIGLAETIAGIGLVGACAAVLRTGGISRYATPSALSAQIGTCPDRNQTGSTRDVGRLTYRGDRRLRTVFYMLTQAACVHDPVMAFHKWRFIQKGLTKKQAVCACMNRLSRLLWGVIRSRHPYDLRTAVEQVEKHHAELWKTYLEETPKQREKLRKKLESSLQCA